MGRNRIVNNRSDLLFLQIFFQLVALLASDYKLMPYGGGSLLYSRKNQFVVLNLCKISGRNLAALLLALLHMAQTHTKKSCL